MGMAALFVFSAPVHAREKKPFIDAADIDLISVLAPPPAAGSPHAADDLGEVLRLQGSRTPAMVAAARADDARKVWRFASVIAPQFRKDQLPVLAKFFRRVVDSGDAVVDRYKNTWKRPRPSVLSEQVMPVVKRSTAWSYPSKHAADATLMGIVLSGMLPEKRGAIMARAADYAYNRVVAGMHYPSDIEAGRITGTLIASRLMLVDDYNAQFLAAKAELRGVLGLKEVTSGE